MVEIIVLLLLIVINGVFAMAEMAVVSARKPRLQQLANTGNSGAQVALDLSAHPDRFLSTIQVGITLIGILAGALGERALLAKVSDVLDDVAVLAPYSETFAFVLIVLGITYLSLVIGELVPKRLALQNPERAASLLSVPMMALSKIGAPAVKLLSWSTQLVFRILGIRPSEEPPVTEEEIKVMLEQGTE